MCMHIFMLTNSILGPFLKQNIPITCLTIILFYASVYSMPCRYENWVN